MKRLIEQTACEHGLMEPHTRYESKPLEAGDHGLSGGVEGAAFLDCPGGSSREVTVDYHAAEMAYFHRDEHAIPWESKARMIVDAALAGDR